MPTRFGGRFLSKGSSMPLKALEQRKVALFKGWDRHGLHLPPPPQGRCFSRMYVPLYIPMAREDSRNIESLCTIVYVIEKRTNFLSIAIRDVFIMQP